MTARSNRQDRPPVSSESHDLKSAGSKPGQGGKAAVIEAKKTRRHRTPRGKDMAIASAMAGHPLESPDAKPDR